jgi:riboflavin kinase/FMN adenylyltransferase
MDERFVITIGTFDGVHLGHRAILRRGRDVADAMGLPLAALAFDPHPSAILRPDRRPPRLQPPDAKREALLEAGADMVVILQPSETLLNQTPEQFIATLCHTQPPAAVVEGHDFRFGRGRAGDIAMLRDLGAAMHFEVHEVPTVEVTLGDHLIVPARSSVIRYLIGCGRVADAAKCLGRLHEIAAPIIEGERRGRTIGVPTINLDVGALGDVLVPGDGVYAGTALLPDGSEGAAAISIGTKPTFDGDEMIIEAHLLDFDGDLYGKTVTLRLALWLRDQQRFPGLDDLKAQLTRDIARTRDGFENDKLRRAALGHAQDRAAG